MHFLEALVCECVCVCVCEALMCECVCARIEERGGGERLQRCCGRGMRGEPQGQDCVV